MKKLAFNPYLPSWEYIPDSEPYVFNNRVYVYGSHDFYNGYVFCMGDYVCWSAPTDDLGNWRYEGVIYPRNADPLNKDGKMCLFAPDVTVGPDGRYYLYYVLDQVSVVSVAVCDTPAGKYEFYGYVHYPDGVRLGEKSTDQPQFDPGVLTEGDRTYLYTGFCERGNRSRNGAMATVLGSDMLTVVEEPGYVGNIQDSVTLGFKYFLCRGIREIRIKVRGYANGAFEVKTAWNGESLASIRVHSSNVWEEYAAPVSIPDGKQAIYLTYHGQGNASILSFTLL